MIIKALKSKTFNNQLAQLADKIESQKKHLFLLFAFLAVTAISPGCNSPSHASENKLKALSTDESTSTKHSDSLVYSRDQILKLIGEGNTEEALGKLTKAESNDFKLLKARFDAARQDYFIHKVIDFQTWAITQAQINYAILELLPKNEREKRPVSRDQVNRLVNENKTEETLRLLFQAGYDDAILVQARFITAQKLFAKGLINSETWEQVQAQIRYAILEFEQWTVKK